MKRITWKNPDGRWGVKGIPWDEIDRRLQGALWRLKDYEETGLSPDEVERMKESFEEDKKEVVMRGGYPCRKKKS